MACDFMPKRYSHYLHSLHATSSNNSPPNSRIYPFKFSKRSAYVFSSIRLRSIPIASANKNPSTVAQKQKSGLEGKRVNSPDSDPDRNSFSVLIRIGEEFKLDGLGMQILSIAVPAALALAADPITSLVDTGFVGHIGSAELAAVGVSAAIFNLVSKLFNVPLLNVTTSFVAEEQASVTKAVDNNSQTAKDQKNKIYLPAVSNALMLAAGLGIIEAVALYAGSGFLMDTMGLTNAHAS